MRIVRAVAPFVALGLVLAACSGTYGGGAAAPTASAPATSAPTAAPSAAAPSAATTDNSGDDGYTYSKGGGGGASPAAASVSVDLAKSSLGTILVDGSGRTLYVFTADSNGSSSCSGTCAENWPPLTSDAVPMVGTGLSAADFATITRSDGSHQVTFHGMPLYYFAGDTAAGNTNGQGIGGKWYVVGSDGSLIK